MKKIVIFTNAFPYLPGEQFLEEEMKFWSDVISCEIFILPCLAKGIPRYVPKNITVDLSCTINHSWVCFLLYTIKSFFDKHLYKEILYLWSIGNLNLFTFLSALKCISRTLRLSYKIRKFVKLNGVIDVAYCYWNDVQSYAACLVKLDGYINKVVSRVHRFDLYEEQRDFNYMPLKRQFVSIFDKVYCLSQEGMMYFFNKYHVSLQRVCISPLGVRLPSGMSKASLAGHIHLVSLSYCVSVKRIDKIISSLVALSKEEPSLKIRWTHIGEGPLSNYLENLSIDSFDGVDNVEFMFLGGIDNFKVREFFIKNRIDLLLNVSESEGVPVSIMEAMSFGVPAVAPDVGGVSYLVSNNLGYLMSNNPSVDEIVNAIKCIYYSADNMVMRCEVREHVALNYNAEKNYRDFVGSISE
ncbi:glycosyltransferase [Zobellella endophytica]|nr:glycosyltransferase [Zobellella endophytica]